MKLSHPSIAFLRSSVELIKYGTDCTALIELLKQDPIISERIKGLSDPVEIVPALEGLLNQLDEDVVLKTLKVLKPIEKELKKYVDEYKKDFDKWGISVNLWDYKDKFSNPNEYTLIHFYPQRGKSVKDSKEGTKFYHSIYPLVESLVKKAGWKKVKTKHYGECWSIKSNGYLLFLDFHKNANETSAGISAEMQEIK